MTTLYIALSIGVAGAVLGTAVWWYRASQSDEPTDLGSVSHTWIAELRAGDPYDPSR